MIGHSPYVGNEKKEEESPESIGFQTYNLRIFCST